jgi:20S proteasome alpha/beta subunit
MDMKQYIDAQFRGVRPYGVSLLVAGWDDHRGPSLYQVDPSGSFWAWKASAIGKNMINAKTFLEKRCVTTRACVSFILRTYGRSQL